MSPKGKAAAIGMANSNRSRNPANSPPRLMARVAAEAIANAGLEKKDINGFLVGVLF